MEQEKLNTQQASPSLLGVRTLTDEMVELWSEMGLPKTTRIKRLQDWANLLERKLAKVDPLYDRTAS